MHHPLTRKVGDSAFFRGPPPTGSEAYVHHVSANIQTWYNPKTAGILRDFKTATDAYGGSLLDYTVVPFVTEVGDPSHTHERVRGSKVGKVGARTERALKLRASARALPRVGRPLESRVSALERKGTFNAEFTDGIGISVKA